jgi:hypothetical protein
MIVSIALEHPHEHYTNLDNISGKVFLRVPNPTNISSIIVKLEGESRTRLLAPIHPNRPDKQRPVLELHKFLYKTQVVWPTGGRPEDIAQNSRAAFTINAGSFEYPFQFKVWNSKALEDLPTGLMGVIVAAQHAMPAVEQPHLKRFLLERDTRVCKDADTTYQGYASA